MLSENGPLHLHQAIVHRPGQTSFIGKTLPALKGVSLLDALGIMQADLWRAKDGYLGLQDVDVPAGVVTSELL